MSDKDFSTGLDVEPPDDVDGLADELMDLQAGSGESAGEVPGGDGELESDDLSAISYTESDDIPETNELDIGDAKL